MPDLYSIEDFVKLINEITVRKSGKDVSPHKYLLLMTICRIIERFPGRANKFPFDYELTDNFRELWKHFLPTEPGLPEYPYYHLKSSPLWNHQIVEGKEQEYKNYKRFTPSRIQETIEYAYLHPRLYNLLKEKQNRDQIEIKIEGIIQELVSSNSSVEISAGYKLADISYDANSPDNRYGTVRSKFPHELQALEQIEEALGKHVELIPNYDLYDPETNQYLDCDLIIVSTDGLAIVELKHWAGKIEILPNLWQKNGRNHEDPHRHNNYKCKVLKGFYRKHFPFYTPDIWVESFVVLSNSDAEIINASKHDTDQHNPTFVIDTLPRYFKSRLHSPTPKLRKEEARKVADRLRRESQGPRQKSLYIQGYKPLVNLTESPHCIELIAQPIGNQLDTVKRLRIFSVDSRLSAEEREKQRIKARNSLKALTSISDHPNILKVWDVFHEDGLVIEASDWSQEDGTLADVIRSQQPISLEKALTVIRGITAGLQAVHSNGIVHRNLQPENIMMFGDTPKLMNFDLSYLPEDNRLTVLPDDVELPKSPYLAPELYIRQPFSEATDLFSLGVIAYELLCGRLPFENSLDLSDEMDEAMKKALSDANTPEQLQILIELLVRKNRLDRPQDTTEVIDMLDDLSIKIPPPGEPNHILQPEDAFGFYCIEKLIGTGREAQIYQAKKGHKTKIAIKLFHQDVPPEQVQKIETLIKKIHSPYVIKCETSNQWTDGRSFLHLQLLPGPSLRKLIQENQRPDLKSFEHATNCLMDALKAMHQDSDSPLLHNDVKPDNILLNQEGEPVLIDFGTAGYPTTGPYKGTDSYIAPDLFQDAEYEFCESSDLFALGITLFEWFCGTKPYTGTPSKSATPESITAFRDDAPPELVQWFEKAIQPLRADRFISIAEMKSEFKSAFAPPESEQHIQQQLELPEYVPGQKQLTDQNPFVDYLNTLHNTTAANEGALAESQARSPYFGAIHVHSPLTDLIYEQLTAPDRGRIILTGHAGDGKSTIALEICKKLKGIPMHQPLEHYSEHECIPFNGLVIHIVKDMSELSGQAREQIIEQSSQQGNENDRWLIISNTGTLLETLKQAEKQEWRKQEIENQVLKLLEQKEPETLNAFGTDFWLINLTQVDNVNIAMQIFKKLIDNEHWESCDYCDIQVNCPIFVNLQALKQAEDIVLQRTGWIYRLLYEYGKRLTMRQITAHLSYAITSGLDCQLIRKMTAYGDIHTNEYLFYNRFFGFKGTSVNENSRHMKAIQYLMPLEMGARPFPSLDRKLWTSETGHLPDLPGALEQIFENLKKLTQNRYGSEATGARLRQEFRRLWFVFGKFPEEEKDFSTGFCGSPMLIEYESWQKDTGRLSIIRLNDLTQKILHVLQEQFAGFHLPEQLDNKELFITLNRRNEALRQSVQIILARIPFFNLYLEAESKQTAFNAPCIVLTLKEKYSHIRLDLELPFLDFVIMRSSGEIGQQLNRAYLDRLERFKAQLLEQYQAKNRPFQQEQTSTLELLEFTDDGKFKVKRIVIDEDILQVMPG